MWSSSSVRDILTISGSVYNLSHPYPCVILYPLGVVRRKSPPKLEVYKDGLWGRLCDKHLSPGGIFLVDMMVFFRPVGIGDYHEAAYWPRLDRLKRMGLILKSFATNGFRQRWYDFGCRSQQASKKDQSRYNPVS
jgi:hypothetical protein